MRAAWAQHPHMGVGSPLSKHDQNRAEKRQRLVRAGLDAFTETGYDNTTVSDVVRRAGMTPSTFYNYYRDKDALLTDILDEVAASLVAAIATVRRESADVADFVRRCCSGLFLAMAGDRGHAMLLRRNLHIVRSMLDHPSLEPVYVALVAELDSAVQRGLLGPIDGEYATALIRATALEVALVMLRRTPTDIDRAVAFASTVMTASLEELSSQRTEAAGPTEKASNS